MARTDRRYDGSSPEGNGLKDLTSQATIIISAAPDANLTGKMASKSGRLT